MSPAAKRLRRLVKTITVMFIKPTSIVIKPIMIEGPEREGAPGRGLLTNRSVQVNIVIPIT